ncbi:LysR substrate binding domain protein [compost metagenome]
MSREGLGIGVVPEGIARHYLSAMGLVLLRLRDEWAERQFYVCVRDMAQLARPVDELLKALTAPAQ